MNVVSVVRSCIRRLYHSTSRVAEGVQLALLQASCSVSGPVRSDNNEDARFDLVLAAPPYDDLRLPLLQKLAKHTRPGGLYVLDWPGKTEAPDFSGLECIKKQEYGDAQLVFYRRIL